MKLNVEIMGDGPPLLIAHGLLGSSRNWGALARRLARRRRVLLVDMRNHGDSPWSDDCGYPAMAGDLAEAVADHADGQADVLGHSMGGKAAMALALTAPLRVGRLVVADIAPVAYGHSHADVIAAMRALDLAGVTRRAEAERMLEPCIPDAAMRAFVAHNLALDGAAPRWRPNLAALAAQMDRLVGWPDGPWRAFEGPTLFLRGGASDYVTPAMTPVIRALFPPARIATIPDAGHWLHAQQPSAFLTAVEDFLEVA